MFVIALLTIPAYRYGSVYLQSNATSQGGASRQELVALQVERDVGVIQARAKQADKTPLERTAAVVKDVWAIMDTIPKIITALSGAWGVVLLWLRR